MWALRGCLNGYCPFISFGHMKNYNKDNKDNSNSDSQEKEGGREETRTKNCAEPSYLSWLPQLLKKYKIKHKTET